MHSNVFEGALQGAIQMSDDAVFCGSVLIACVALAIVYMLK